MLERRGRALNHHLRHSRHPRCLGEEERKEEREEEAEEEEGREEAREEEAEEGQPAANAL